jgi:hypothetical protein
MTESVWNASGLHRMMSSERFILRKATFARLFREIILKKFLRPLRTFFGQQY